MPGDTTNRRSSVHISQVFAPSLTTLLLRLEAATSRLEDIATSVNTPDQTLTANGTPVTSTHAHSTPTLAPGSSTKPLPVAGVAPSPPSVADELPAEIEDFDKLLNEDLATFVKLSSAMDPVIAEQVGTQKHTYFAAEV